MGEVKNNLDKLCQIFVHGLPLARTAQTTHFTLYCIVLYFVQYAPSSFTQLATLPNLFSSILFQKHLFSILLSVFHNRLKVYFRYLIFTTFAVHLQYTSLVELY